jgi:NAD(P)-dependent dehydrogenase (short-subunit alcohol dehydrogenase family)
MSRIFITGSSDGLGKMVAQFLVDEEHNVVLHARNETRATAAMKSVSNAEAVVIGDLSSIKETISVAEQVNKLGAFDAIIHNAGIGDRQSSRNDTVDGLPSVFAVNSLAPYILTCLINQPKRLIYLSSGLHKSGDPNLKDIEWKTRRWNGFNAYSDSKLHDVMLAFAVARKWPAVYSNALDPGWVPTKMGGPNAPDNLEDGFKTQAWLAVSEDPGALVTGKYFHHKKIQPAHSAASDIDLQEEFLQQCARISTIQFPLR